MYVTGRGTDGPGTILPSLFQCASEGLVERISVAATRPESAREAVEAAEALAEQQGVDVPVTASPETKYDDRAFERVAENQGPDCAVISVPDHLHHPIAAELLDRGIHVQVVKPLTPTLEEARDLIARADETGAVGRVEFHKRYDESNLLLREIVRSGRLGEPVEFAVRYSQRKSIPETAFRGWVEETDVFQYLGVHYVDLIHFFTGALPVRISSRGRRGWLTKKGIDAHDAVHTTVEWEADSYESPFVSTHFTSWIDPERSSAMSDQRIHFVGTRGRVECDQKDRGIRIQDEKGFEHRNPYFSEHLAGPGESSPSFRGYGHESIRHFVADVARAERGDSEPGELTDGRATFRAALPSVAAVEASRLSLERDGEWIDVPDVSDELPAS